MTDKPETPRRNYIRFLPLVVIIALGLIFQFGLSRDDARRLPSMLIDKPAPMTDLPPLLDGMPGINSADFADGKVKIVNVWASWCVPCRAEHPFLMALAKEGVDIRGFNYKDTDAQAKQFIGELGNPYTAVGTDKSGRAGIEWGVYGVPETFVINGDGRIIYKHVGPFQGSDITDKLRPALEAAAGG